MTTDTDTYVISGYIIQSLSGELKTKLDNEGVMTCGRTLKGSQNDDLVYFIALFHFPKFFESQLMTVIKLEPLDEEQFQIPHIPIYMEFKSFSIETKVAKLNIEVSNLN